MKYCTKCLNVSTRPRIEFNKEGICNACVWAEEKKTIINWEQRWAKLEELCEKYKKLNPNRPNVIVPYSGGKDGAYNAYILRDKLGMHPLCITIRPPIEDPLGKQNIQNFLDRGFDHVFITPNRRISKEIDKDNFINHGIPMHAFMMSVHAAIWRCAVIYDIPFVMYAEEGESEYGGSTELKYRHNYDIEHSINFYLSGIDPRQYIDKYSEQELYWFIHPSKEEIIEKKLDISHMSYFEHFSNYKHYLVAKEKLGLIEREERNVGSYENFSTTDTYLIWLYFYLMYLKFGFGRTTTIVGNDIREGALTRDQGINLVKKYDGEYPEQYIDLYLSYYQMTKEEFDEVLDKHANKDLFVKRNGFWEPTFVPE
tara:strand:- start:9588 stop:10694 length:1107 start_codon:yes stop_codon:yes gene_type:complete